MSNYQCSCYWEYPNPMHRHNNGKWKCVDNYEKCEDWQPKSIYSCKTHCRRKEVTTMNKEVKLIELNEVLTVLRQLREENMYNQYAYRVVDEAIKRIDKIEIIEGK